VIPKQGRRITEAITTVVVVCLSVRVAAWLIGPLLPILIGVGVVYAVALGFMKRR
jgi:CHASE2 domain-containing sensor protein